MYTSVKIGTQEWLAENLKTTRYNDGTSIPNVKDDTEWKNLTTPGYCWYDNEPTKYKNFYGGLYNWYAVNTGKICPVGWHVPSDDEWHQLIMFLDPGSELSTVESNVAGGMLKESGTVHWLSPNEGATDSNGFTALPGGGRGNYGGFGSVGISGLWWTSTKAGSENAWDRGLACDASNIYRNAPNLWVGWSVRCIKDN